LRLYSSLEEKIRTHLEQGESVVKGIIGTKDSEEHQVSVSSTTSMTHGDVRLGSTVSQSRNVVTLRSFSMYTEDKEFLVTLKKSIKTDIREGSPIWVVGNWLNETRFHAKFVLRPELQQYVNLNFGDPIFWLVALFGLPATIVLFFFSFNTGWLIFAVFVVLGLISLVSCCGAIGGTAFITSKPDQWEKICEIVNRTPVTAIEPEQVEQEPDSETEQISFFNPEEISSSDGIQYCLHCENPITVPDSEYCNKCGKKIN